MDISPLALVVLIGFGLLLASCLLIWSLLGSGDLRGPSVPGNEGQPDEGNRFRGDGNRQAGREIRSRRDVLRSGNKVGNRPALNVTRPSQQSPTTRDDVPMVARRKPDEDAFERFLEAKDEFDIR